MVLAVWIFTWIPKSWSSTRAMFCSVSDGVKYINSESLVAFDCLSPRPVRVSYQPPKGLNIVFALACGEPPQWATTRSLCVDPYYCEGCELMRFCYVLEVVYYCIFQFLQAYLISQDVQRNKRRHQSPARLMNLSARFALYAEGFAVKARVVRPPNEEIKCVRLIFRKVYLLLGTFLEAFFVQCLVKYPAFSQMRSLWTMYRFLFGPMKMVTTSPATYLSNFKSANLITKTMLELLTCQSPS
jgi:hypothetical protein